jgi:hypothetical protein
LMAMLSSFYTAEIPSTNYGVELKAFAQELARIKIRLDDTQTDTQFSAVRSEFLYQIIGYLVFTDGKLPTIAFDDIGFKTFLLAIINIYFQGSIPLSIQEGIQLFTSDNVTVRENYLEVEQGNSDFDISDQFTFDVDFEISGNVVPQNFTDLNDNLKLMIGLIKPAHTLFRIQYIFKDTIDKTKWLDTYTWDMQNYNYEDIRRNWSGLKGVNRLGAQEENLILREDVSYQF